MPIATRNDRSISYTSIGDGPAIVMHHPMFHRGDAWTRAGYTDALVHRYRLIEIDLLGHGCSSKPSARESYRLEELTRDTIAVLDDAGIEHAAAVWGYSLGGWVACGAAAHAPERFSRFVIGGWDPARGMQSIHDELRLAFDLPPDTDWFEMTLDSAAMAPGLRHLRDDWQHDALRACHDEFIAAKDLTPVLTAVAERALFYCGANDPSLAEMMASATKTGVEMVTLPELDHDGGWSEASSVLTGVSTFLESAIVI